MPSKKTNANNDYIPPPVSETTQDLLDQEPAPRTGRAKKNKHAKQTRVDSTQRSSEPVTQEASPSPPTEPHIARAFPHRQRPDAEELIASEKVSDEHTPPQDSYLPPPSEYGRSPPVELLPGFSHPPYQSHLGKGGFNGRSPPTSPPQAKARPVSYGGPPSTTGYVRNTPSPYAYPTSNFGSPPPHMPQQHFYNAQDIDLGLRQPVGKSQSPSFIKFANPGLRDECLVLVGTTNHLDVLSYGNDKLLSVGRLHNLPGIVHDAVLLTWTNGPDPYRELRPLVALTINEFPKSEEQSDFQSLDETSRRGSIAVNQTPHLAMGTSTSVMVYSLKGQSYITTLLHVPPNTPQQFPAWMDRAQPTKPVGRLKLQASGNSLIVGSGVSGELYVFGVQQIEGAAHLVCQDKLWTTIQPRSKRRDSSHTRPKDVGVQVVPQNAPETEEQPIFNVNGRWLAYCPALSSPPSLGALLGETVLCSNSSSITSRSAPARPVANCAVDSPDVETILGRVAKGVAQEVLKGGKWLGEKGFQAWQSYWSPEGSGQPSPSPSPVYSPQQGPSPFPPTHGESAETTSKEPEIVSIIDLRTLQSQHLRKAETFPLATFQPPGGCSYLSFMPNGLGLLTASRRGDIYYVWDLLQVRYPRMLVSDEGEPSQVAARVRQIAKNERFSESVIADVQWEAPRGLRYTVLTQNCTVHMFDVPASALRWPPPRVRKKKRPVSVPVATPNTTAQEPTSFLSSAMNFANSRAQPMLANLRGRTPSMGGGVSGIGSSGLGYASATGMRGGKVVAAGFSKSLGAATDTVANIRHAGQSKLHLKTDAVAGRLAWTCRDRRLRLSILDSSGIRNYYIRKTNPRERQPESLSVFDSRKAVSVKLSPELLQGTAEADSMGFWHGQTQRKSSAGLPAPLSFAEIDTNAPYQPFHSDQRVTISIYPTDGRLTNSHFPTSSTILHNAGSTPAAKESPNDKWIFGQDIPTIRINTGVPDRDSPDDEGLPQRSVGYRETTIQPADVQGEMEQIVSTTRRRKIKPKRGGLSVHGQDTGAHGDMVEDGDPGDLFFEDDCDVLDFAEDRV